MKLNDNWLREHDCSIDSVCMAKTMESAWDGEKRFITREEFDELVRLYRPEWLPLAASNTGDNLMIRYAKQNKASGRCIQPGCSRGDCAMDPNGFCPDCAKMYDVCACGEAKLKERPTCTTCYAEGKYKKPTDNNELKKSTHDDKTSMKVIIAGSRTITDISMVHRTVIASGWSQQIAEVVCGGAKGVDTLGEQLAFENKVPVKYFPADWNAHGKSAGFMRNKQMADYADALILVWDGSSKGSAHMKETAKTKGIPIFEKIVSIPFEQHADVNIDHASPLDKTQKLCDSCIRAKDYPLTTPLVDQCGYRIFDDAGNLCWPCPCWLPFPEGTVIEALSGSLEVKVMGNTQYDEDGNKESQAWARHKSAQADNEAIADSDGMADDHAMTLREAVALARREALEEKKLKLAMLSAERNAGFVKDFDYRRDALIIKTQIEYLGIPQPKLK